MSDQDLLENWRAGDADAGTVLFRRYFDRVARFFRTKVDPLDVEDMVQRTFTGLVEGRDRFRGEGQFAAFVFGVARRQFLQYLRARTKNQADPDLNVSSIEAFGITPTSLVAARQEQQWVQQALQRIPVHFQMMLELSYWEEISGPELAEALGISPTTVRTRLFRAREALERELRKIVGLEDEQAMPFDIGVAAREAGRLV